MPVQVALIPVVELYHTIGNITGYNPFGTIVGVVIFHVGFGLPFGIFLMRNFYLGIPRDLVEAGRMDGARECTLFRRVVLPLGLPAVAALAVFQFVWVWNDLLVALVFLGGNPHVPLTVFLFDQTRSLGRGLLDHRNRGHRLDPHPAGRVLRVPATLRPRHACRRGQVRTGDMSRVVLNNLTKTYRGGVRGREQRLPGGLRRRVRVPGRSLRMRQDHGAADDQRAGGDQRAARSRSAIGSSTTCPRASGTSRMVFQSYALYPHMTVFAEHQLRARDPKGPQARAREGRP